MNKFEQDKAKRRQELLTRLAAKKKELQNHLAESVDNSVDLGKGMLALGAAVVLLYTVFDRFLEARFKTINRPGNTSSSKNASQKLLFPFFSMLLQQGSGALFAAGQNKLISYLQRKKNSHVRVPKHLSGQK